MDEAVKTDKTESKQGGTQSHIAIYQRIAAHAEELIDGLLELTHSRNENIALGARKILINKILPDKKAVEVTGENGEPIKLFIDVGQGFIPGTLPRQYQITTSSTGSTTTGLTPIQGTGVAPESKEDNNSNSGTGEASAS